MNQDQEKRGTVRNTLDKITDTVGGLAGRASASTVTRAEDFVEQAAIGNLYEIEAARIALDRSRGERVREIAQKMIEDHRGLKHKLEAATAGGIGAGASTATGAGTTPGDSTAPGASTAASTSSGEPGARQLKLPLELDTRRSTMIDHLRKAPDDAFDGHYLDQQVAAHKETLSLMRSYRDGGDDERLKQFARESAPMIESHLERVEAAQQRLA